MQKVSIIYVQLGFKYASVVIKQHSTKKGLSTLFSYNERKKVILFFLYQENSVHIFPPKRLQLLNQPIPKLDTWTGSNTIKHLHNNDVKEGASVDGKVNSEYLATGNLKNSHFELIEDNKNNQIEKKEKSEVEKNEEEGNHF